MKKSAMKRNQSRNLDGLMEMYDDPAGALPSACGLQVTGDDFAKYSYAMLLSLQRLAFEHHQDTLARLLGVAAVEAEHITKPS